MVVNLDQAEKCLELAKKRYQEGDLEAAIKFTNKSIRLHKLTQAETLLEKLSKELKTQNPSKNNPSPFSSQTTSTDYKQPISTTNNNNNTNSNSNTSSAQYTPEQKAAVKKILSLKNDLYAVLGLDKAADQSDIKKAYRKAFTTLSDTDKKSTYDMYGSEASERATSSHSQNSHFYSNNSRNFAHFESEINPEDLFNMFFGGNK
ncbi:DnaJ-like protein [Smittium culicis]|uniref:DnaJ-like protein n=1 Tax=Smittium culicis TaxID=133412 RepID=A0A1R1XNN6_9FUNG|nr:DnaJ-like protein [Smittium culicis]OMJ16257.1 DnaJ-like protein [Smittium culicis]